MEQKNVVTSFLIHEGKVLILKRSTKVGSMRGMWAGVSGYLESGEEPLDRALQEIEEETGFLRSKVKFLKRGEAVEAPDPVRRDLVWVVHPFLFQVEESDVRIDWEHDEYRWIRPGDIDQYSTVPSLKEALQKVLL